MRPFFWVLVILMCFGSSATGQINFLRYNNLPVQESGRSLVFPWAGGLNNAKIATIDLDGQGATDLFVFDPIGSFVDQGNRVLTFVNKGTPDSVDYTYAPQYASEFPHMDKWALLKDFNCDGRKDIFTATVGGIKVYKNTGIQNGQVTFSLHTNFLSYIDSSNAVQSIKITTQDIPAFIDINNDGDLDMLTFDTNNNKYVVYYENQSQEIKGNCDTLIYKRTSDCWGYFSEGALTNDINLDDTCGSNKRGAHGGSTLLAFDEDNDNDKELFLGDLTFPNMVFLRNGGTPNNAHMIAKDTIFPRYDSTIDINIFPAAYLEDVDNDSRKDLIVVPHSTSASKNFNNLLFYKNMGQNDSMRFYYQRSDFLQRDMIEMGSQTNPRFFDYNADGKLDLVIGNYDYFDGSSSTSSLSLYENIGTNSQPSFSRVSTNYANTQALGTLGLCPTFGDLDDDGDVDMLVGEHQGELHFYENTAGAGNIANFNLAATSYQGIDVGNFSTPQLVDLNRDSLLDLVIGNRNGQINYFENTGTPDSAVFTYVTDTLGGVDVKAPGWLDGFSVPFVTEIPDSNGYYLFVGSMDGDVHLYDNIDNNLSGQFNLVSATTQKVYEGGHASIGLGQLAQNDSKIEMVLGNYRGGVTIYRQTDSIFGGGPTVHANPSQLKLYPNPASQQAYIDLSPTPPPPYELTIFNLVGKRVLHRSLSSIKTPVDIHTLPTGLYFVRLQTTSRIYTGKLMIQR